MRMVRHSESKAAPCACSHWELPVPHHMDRTMCSLFGKQGCGGLKQTVPEAKDSDGHSLLQTAL